MHTLISLHHRNNRIEVNKGNKILYGNNMSNACTLSFQLPQNNDLCSGDGLIDETYTKTTMLYTAVTSDVQSMR